MVRIEDEDGGAEAYTFDVYWGAGGSRNPPLGSYRPDYQDRNYPDSRYRPDYRDTEYYRRYGRGFRTDEAIRVCQDAIHQQASRRFRRADIRFHRTAIDDNPGRRDWVVGSIDVYRPAGFTDRFQFACSVNFDNGRVLSAQLDQRPISRFRY